MEGEKFTNTSMSIKALLGLIEANDIAIPEIQRPFVWKRAQVRDLMDSLYKGYPTGYIILWKNPDVKLKDGRMSAGKKIVIDGQQRITAMMTAIAGRTVLDSDFEETQIKIAFNPFAALDFGGEKIRFYVNANDYYGSGSSNYLIKHDEETLFQEPSIVVLVGPSGSGKSKIASWVLEKTDKFQKLVSYTTSDPTAVEKNEWYNYVNIETFRQMCESGEMFQSTMYAGHGYGSCKSDVENILKKGKHVLTTMDICGAMSLKTYYKNVVTIYMKRDKKALMANILRKNSSIEDKLK